MNMVKENSLQPEPVTFGRSDLLPFKMFHQKLPVTRFSVPRNINVAMHVSAGLKVHECFAQTRMSGSKILIPRDAAF